MKTILIFLLALTFGISVFSQNKLEAVHFDFDVYELNDQNKKALDNLISQLNDKEITLKGYTDFIGSKAYNDKLSNQRVNSVKAYLLQKGINEANIVQSIGLGELTEFKDRAKNRRVDVLVTPIVKNEVVEEVIEIEGQPASSLDKINDLEVGESIALENMEFIPGRHFLKEYSKPILQDLLSTMQKHLNLKIEIQGHICCDYSGDDGLDWDTQTKDLSNNRAKHIYEYLVREGIDKNRLSYKGFGSSKPLVEEITEADQQKNRRVEIMIVEK